MQYQSFRSVSDNHVFVLCYDGGFYDHVPDDVRRLGPWQGTRRGAAEALKPEHRLALARAGYALVRCDTAVFKPEEWNDLAIRCEGLRTQIWVNGLKTVDYTEPEADIPRRGRFGLQIHGGEPAEAAYKDIRIQRLAE